MPELPRLYDYAASGNCLKVRMALGLLEKPFERVPVDIFAGDTLTEAFAAVNPARTTPVLEFEPGRFLAESNAILLYVAEGSRLMPESLADVADVWRWLFFERSFTSVVGGRRFLRLTGRDGRGAAAVAENEADGRRLLGQLDLRLADRPFLAGERLTVADLSVFAYAHVAEEGGFGLAPFEHVRRWLQRVAATSGLVVDLEPYPANARPGAGRSIYG